ncbi:MAG: hypothetical protein ACPGED_06590 [Flavobacteriales bacterium]
MKKLRFKLVLALLVFTVLIREEIYRGLIHYENDGLRARVLLKNPLLKAELDQWVMKQQQAEIELSTRCLIRKSLQITSRELRPVGSKLASHTNHILLEGKANRTGYSRLFGEVFSYLVELNGTGHLLMHHHLKGTPKFNDWNIPFVTANEYDYNQVIDVQRRTVYTLNPLLFDRTGIGIVKVASID